MYIVWISFLSNIIIISCLVCACTFLSILMIKHREYYKASVWFRTWLEKDVKVYIQLSENRKAHRAAVKKRLTHKKVYIQKTFLLCEKDLIKYSKDDRADKNKNKKVNFFFLTFIGSTILWQVSISVIFACVRELAYIETFINCLKYFIFMSSCSRRNSLTKFFQHAALDSVYWPTVNNFPFRTKNVIFSRDLSLRD